MKGFPIAKMANRTMFIDVGSAIILLQIHAILGWFGIQTF